MKVRVMQHARGGTVYLVGAGPGDPGLLTLRGRDLLASADVVLHDELVHRALLELVRPDAAVEYVGKRGVDPAEKQRAQATIDARLIELAQRGKSVVRLKGGDPFVFGRGSEEAASLAKAGVPFEVVPGVTSPIAAPAYAGISLTHRDLASSVVFVSGTTRKGAAFDFAELRGHTGTVCVLMGMKRLRAIAEALVRDAGRAPETPVAIIRAGTRSDQRVIEGTLADIADRAEEMREEMVAGSVTPDLGESSAQAGGTPPAMIVVGEVVRLRSELRWFDALPLFGARVLVGRAAHQAAGTAELLRVRGAEPVLVPLIAMEDPPDVARVDRAVAELSSYNLVAFTSENGVERFFAALARAKRDVRAFAGARVAAIGEGTAAALARHGLLADLVPTVFRGEALADAVMDDLRRTRGRVPGARVLVPRAMVAREVLPDQLRAAGAEVDVVPVYQTRALKQEEADHLIDLLRAGALDAVLLTSSSMADAFADVVARASGLDLSRLTVASIGPITTATAEKRGLRVAVNAEVSTLAGLVAALEASRTARAG